MTQPNALASLYGDGHLNAVRTRECVAMPGARDQVVRTPQGVVDGLRTLWPEGVAFDPCGAEGSIVGAARSTATRGLLQQWPHRTYANPPYGESLRDPEREVPLVEAEIALKAEEAERARSEGRKPRPLRTIAPGAVVERCGLWDWLAHHLAATEGESVMLVPNRTNRKWLRQWRAQVDGLVELDPLVFLGHRQAFPAPLVLGFLCRLLPEDAALKAERVRAFHRAFAHLGDPASASRPRPAGPLGTGRLSSAQ